MGEFDDGSDGAPAGPAPTPEAQAAARQAIDQFPPESKAALLDERHPRHAEVLAEWHRLHELSFPEGHGYYADRQELEESMAWEENRDAFARIAPEAESQIAYGTSPPEAQLRIKMIEAGVGRIVHGGIEIEAAEIKRALFDPSHTLHSEAVGMRDALYEAAERGYEPEFGVPELPGGAASPVESVKKS
jgi:hypothetical protein